MNLPLLKGKRLHIVLHIIGWVILLILPLYLLLNFSTGKTSWGFVEGFYLRSALYVFLFYINYLWLVPKFLFNKKIKIYFVALGIVMVALFFINEKGHRLIFENSTNLEQKQNIEKLERSNSIPKVPHQFYVYDFLLSTIFVTGFSIGLYVSERLIKNEKEKKELEKEKLNSELAFLKNQVSPHFFFNTLNNIYSLVQINTDDAQKAILNLSKLMRYLLYESEQGDTKLYQEIEFMQNYINLMKLRLNNKVDLKVSFPDSHSEMAIPPLLFISFIENAFKHGVSYREKSFIDISFRISGNKIQFRSSNSLVVKSKEVSTGSGIGLDNVQKRLNLLFPYKHKLEIVRTSSDFNVMLEIDLA
jgi:two-component system, LytTR family, sensor kinase